MEADAVGLRVVGCLIEKQRTTPDVYPLSLNALRAACNQTTNRDPVVSYDEPTIRTALDRLSRLGWVRLASGPGSRAAKYRHLLDEALGLSGAEISLLAVLMLRGPQTPGELNQRTDRLYGFAGLAEVEETLEAMAARELVARQPRRPGQKEDRYAHLLGGEEPAPAADASFAGVRGGGRDGRGPRTTTGSRGSSASSRRSATRWPVCVRRCASCATASGRSYQPVVPRAPLNGAGDVARDPAAVEAALLRLHDLAVERALVHQRGVERDCVADRLEARPRVAVRPRGALDAAAVGAGHVEVRRVALPLAERLRPPDGASAPGATSSSGT